MKINVRMFIVCAAGLCLCCSCCREREGGPPYIMLRVCCSKKRWQQIDKILLFVCLIYL